MGRRYHSHEVTSEGAPKDNRQKQTWGRKGISFLSRCLEAKCGYSGCSVLRVSGEPNNRALGGFMAKPKANHKDGLELTCTHCQDMNGFHPVTMRWCDSWRVFDDHSLQNKHHPNACRKQWVDVYFVGRHSGICKPSPASTDLSLLHKSNVFVSVSSLSPCLLF